MDESELPDGINLPPKLDDDELMSEDEDTDDGYNVGKSVIAKIDKTFEDIEKN